MSQSLAPDCEQMLDISYFLNHGHLQVKTTLNQSLALSNEQIRSCCSWTTNSNFSWWNFLESLPSLQLFVRLWFSLQQLFVFMPQRYISSVRCQEISLHLRRNIFTKHDFVVYLKSLRGDLLLVMNMSPILCTFVICCILTLRLAYLLVFLFVGNLVKTTCLPIRGLMDAYYKIKMWAYSFMSKSLGPSQPGILQDFWEVEFQISLHSMTWLHT